MEWRGIDLSRFFAPKLQEWSEKEPDIEEALKLFKQSYNQYEQYMDFKKHLNGNPGSYEQTYSTIALEWDNHENVSATIK